MTTEDFISESCYRVDEAMGNLPTPPSANLWPREGVTVGLLFALKGAGNRTFYRWLHRAWRLLFPALPERPRLFGLLATHRTWADELLATPAVLGVVDSYGLELSHPLREGRSRQQLGRKGTSHPRWIVGGNLWLLLTQWGLVVGWDRAGPNAPGTAFPPLIAPVEEGRIGLSATAFQPREGEPAKLKLCDRGPWKTRMLVEPVLSMVHGACHLKKVAHRTWAAFQPRLAFTLATFNLLVQWYGLNPDAGGFIQLSLAEFSL